MTKSLQDSETDTTSDAKILSFIVRIWKDQPSTKKRQIVWRGFVSSVPDGKRFHFSDVNKIPTLIIDYLKEQS